MATQIFGRLFPKTLISLTSFRSFSTRATILSLIKRLNHSPHSSALKLRNGCDYYRSFVVMQKHEIGPYGRFRCEPTRIEIIHDYIKTLADLVGCEEEARMMVYSGLIGEHYYFFGTLLSEELHYKVKGLPGVSRVRRENIDEMTWSMPLDQLEKKFKKAIAKEEEFLRLLLTK